MSLPFSADDLRQAMRHCTPSPERGYETWTVGAGVDRYELSRIVSRWLKLGPLTVNTWKSDDGDPRQFELHWRNKLVKMLPGWPE